MIRTRRRNLPNPALRNLIGLDAQLVTLIGSNGLPADPPATVPCLRRAPAANGLLAGQYLGPFTDFIFPENLVSGDNPVPYNLWAFGFLMNGEGPGTGRLIPTPW